MVKARIVKVKAFMTKVIVKVIRVLVKVVKVMVKVINFSFSLHVFLNLISSLVPLTFQQILRPSSYISCSSNELKILTEVH